MNKLKYLKLLALIFSMSFFSCESSTSPINNDLCYDEVIKYSLNKLSQSVQEVPEDNYPIRTNYSNKWDLTSASAWTSGFFPGCLWYANKISHDDKFQNSAILFTEGLEQQQFNTEHHDVGFMILNSYGHAFEQTNNEPYKDIILQSANSLATRYNINVGCIQSWNGEFQVIIDNMMNLEILFWAAKNGGDNRLYDIAVNHAYKTLENHVRTDGSSFHVVHYDPNSGEVIKKRAAQGYSTNSTWARGQAWGIYGFTMCYRETGDVNFLNAAINMSDYYIHNLPDDYIPFWDFGLPDNYDKKYKDASAATITLSALLELRNYLANPNQYDDVITNTYNSLIDNYLSINSNSSGIINHCAYNVNSDNPLDWDAATIWGDYYFMESLVRYQNFPRFSSTDREITKKIYANSFLQF